MDFHPGCPACEIARNTRLDDYDTMTLHDLQNFGVPKILLTRVTRMNK